MEEKLPRGKAFLLVGEHAPPHPLGYYRRIFFQKILERYRSDFTPQGGKKSRRGVNPFGPQAARPRTERRGGRAPLNEGGRSTPVNMRGTTYPE